MDVVRRYQTFEGVSEEAQKLFEERLRPKTRKNYDANWRKFDNWCSRREIDSSHASRSVVINFLGEMAAMHKPESLRAYRAAIVSARPDLDLSGDVFVAGLIKGARNRCGYPRGARPERWDTGMVLEKLKSWGPWSSLNLARLQKKVLLLVSLATCWRPRSDMGRIFLQSIQLEGDDDWPSAMVLTVSQPKGEESKTSPRINRFEEDREICPVLGVAELMRRTESLRAGRPKAKERLFLQSIPPHRNAAEDTLARWIRETLCEAGIDVTKYSPHSIRSTAATTALERGIPLDRIMESAGWKSVRTFRNHYFRPQVDTEEVAGAILKEDGSRTVRYPLKAQGKKARLTTKKL